MQALMESLYAGEPLSQSESGALFSGLVQGDLGQPEISALLVALKMKGECPEEIAGAVEAIRKAARPFPDVEGPLVDCCGTGGDGHHTLNISTAVALVAASAGLKMVKHGNGAVSSKCGSANLLEALGIPLQVPPERARNCLEETGFCFLFAPFYHPGIGFAMPVRQALKTRTIFNLLGPLVNPAGPGTQLLGVYDPRHLDTMAETLARLGCNRALVVHGSGLDEIAVHGPTQARQLENGRITGLVIEPATAGIDRHPLESLRGGDIDFNKRALLELLGGQGNPAYRDAVAINTGALLNLAGRAADLQAGTAIALELLASGAVRERLTRITEFFHD